MSARWADEVAEQKQCEPVAALEPFYILAALEFGDPNQEEWLFRNAAKFYEFWKSYRKHAKGPKFSGPEVVLQYIFWYQREQPVDTK